MLLMGGKPKGKPPVEEDDAEKAGGGAEDTLAGEAFDAFQDGDREGFIAAFKSAVKACAGKAKAGGYEDEGDDDEGF
jgi:hypothetical protein